MKTKRSKSMPEENCPDCDQMEMRQYIGTKIIMAVDQPCPSDRHTSKKGDPGYKVVYEDGYVSWSPASTFESAYRQTDMLNFGMAIEAMRRGYGVARKGWNGKGIFCKLQTPGAQSKMTAPYIYIDTTDLQTENPHAPKMVVPWLASQTDMLAEDWQIVEL
jgi:hypothetical protein